MGGGGENGRRQSISIVHFSERIDPPWRIFLFFYFLGSCGRGGGEEKGGKEKGKHLELMRNTASVLLFLPYRDREEKERNPSLPETKAQQTGIFK